MANTSVIYINPVIWRILPLFLLFPIWTKINHWVTSVRGISPGLYRAARWVLVHHSTVTTVTVASQATTEADVRRLSVTTSCLLLLVSGCHVREHAQHRVTDLVRLYKHNTHSQCRLLSLAYIWSLTLNIGAACQRKEWSIKTNVFVGLILLLKASVSKNIYYRS